MIDEHVRIENHPLYFCFFFFAATAATEIYTLSLHDALPICANPGRSSSSTRFSATGWSCRAISPARSEEHTSELQSQSNLVCRLLLEKKKANLSLLLLPRNDCGRKRRVQQRFLRLDIT